MIKVGKFMTARALRTALKAYSIHAKNRDMLGEVAWDGFWREYVFSPGPNTAFSADLLRDLADFIVRCNAIQERDLIRAFRSGKKP